MNHNNQQAPFSLRLIELIAVGILVTILIIGHEALVEIAPILVYVIICVVLAFLVALTLQYFIERNRRAELEAERYRHETYRFAPTDTGNYAAYFDAEGRTFIQAMPGNVIQPVPQTYSPHITMKNEAMQLPPPGAPSLATQAYNQPTLETIVQELHPNALEFVFGLDPLTGQLAKTTLPKAVHIQLLGASGQGKSRQAISILTQLTARNDPSHLKLALVDCEGETTAPFQQLPHVRWLADEPKEAARAFRGLVQELERRDVSRLAFPVLLIFVEEFLNLRRTMPADYRDQVLEDYTTLALRGRKRGMFLFSIGQTAYTEKAIRDAQMQFLSSMAFAIKPTAARSAGFTNTELLNRLYDERRPGQFLLERPAGDNILLAPYVDPHTVQDILGFTATSPVASMDVVIEADAKPDAKATNGTLDARSQHIRDLLKQGLSQRQIIQDIWGVSGGAAYTKASQEMAKIIATLI